MEEELISVEITVFENPQDTAEGFAEWLFEWVSSTEGAVHIALSGGSTPKRLFKHLADCYAEDFPWNRIHLWWVDERCVPPTHEDSNYGMTKKLLLDKVDIPADQVHRIIGENDPDTEARRYGEEILARVPERESWPEFDLVLLGMGGDGHTASIFPNRLDLIETATVTVSVTHPSSGQPRVSITHPVINNAKHVVFLITGPDKADMLQQVLDAEEANISPFPAAFVEPDGGLLSYYLDVAAASKLDLEDEA